MNSTIEDYAKPYGYIYMIENQVNGKKYIGQTTNKRGVRGAMTNAGLKDKYWGNPHLLRALEKYGIKNFHRKIIDSAKNQENLDKKETFYIEKFKSVDYNKGYNIRFGGNGGGKIPRKTREKMSKGATEKYNKNPELKKQISKSLKQYYNKNKVSLLTKEKISKALLGKKKSKEHIENLKKANIGENNPMYGCRGIKHPNYGRKLKKEVKEKISKSLKEYWKKKKEGLL